MIKQFRALVRLMFEYLPHDNKAGNLMSALYSLYKGKKQWLEGDQEAELTFDRLITGLIVKKGVPVIQNIRKWIEASSRLEIHMPFESIPNERKNQVTLGVKLAFSLVANIKQSKDTLDTMVTLQCDFLDRLLSLPTINKYWFPLVFDPNQEDFRPLNLKNMYSSYLFSKKADEHEETKEESKGDNTVLGELKKDENKMFIFANTFEMLHTRLLE